MDGGENSGHAAEETSLHQYDRRLAIIECEDAEKWEGYTETLWKEALREAGDCWTLYKACAGELPTPAEAATFDAIVIGGSHYSAYEEHEWIQKMLELLPQYIARGARIYGCCFGCQILARALGGSVGANPDGKFVLTLEQIQPTPELQQLTELHQLVQHALADACTLKSSSVSKSDSLAAAVQSAAAADERQRPSSASPSAADVNAVVDGLHEMQMACSSGCFRLIESHGDQVLSLPPGAIRLATSATAVNELWCYGPNVLASQFHVEFDEPLVLDKIWQTLKDAGRLDEQQAAESRDVLEAGGQNNGSMLQVIRYFLKHGLPAVDTKDITDSNSNNSSSSSGSSGEGGADAAPSKSCPRINPSSGSISSSRGSGGAEGGRGADEKTQNPDQEQQQQQVCDATATAGFSCNLPSAADTEAFSAGEELAAYPSSMAAAVTAAVDSADSGVRRTNDTTEAAALVALPESSSKTPNLQESICSEQHERNQHEPLVDTCSGTGGLSSVITSLRHDALVGDLSAAVASGASSPTALSEHSVATAASTSSTVPFSQIAYQRRQQQREEGLVESSRQMVDAAAEAFDVRMECYNLDLETLQQLNEAAAEQYNSTAEIATALCQFVTDLETRQAAAREALAVLPQVDRHLKLLENAVGQLDRRSKDLEARLGLGKSSAYDYLASTLGKAGSSVSAAAYYAAGGGTCLGGGAVPKQ